MDTLKSYACSFAGRRKNNEDSYIIFEPTQRFHLFAVADGMGGANAGEIASSLAIETISNFFSQELDNEHDYKDEEFKEVIRRGYQKVQLAIAESIRNNPSYSGMGTTLVILLYARDKWFCANLGDSRLYIIRNDGFKQITKDHSLLQQYLDSHEQPPDDEWVRKYSNYLVKALDGTDSGPDVISLSEEERDLSSGLCFLLCSDGILSDKKKDVLLTLDSIVHSARNIQEAAEQLVSSAFYNGSADNITVILVETLNFKHLFSKTKKLPFPPTGKEEVTKPRRKIVLKICAITSAILLCLIAIIFISIKDVSKVQLSYYEPNSNPTSEIKQKIIKPGNINKISVGWRAFNQDDYRLPVNGSTMIIWNPFNDSSGVVSGYIIRIYLEGKVIDSTEVRSGINSVKFDTFKKLLTAKKYSAQITAYLSNGQNAEGNSITFTYH